MPTPLRTLLLTATLYLLFALALLGRRHWNPTGLVMVGSLSSARDSLPVGFEVVEGQVGYDGRYFYLLARHPFTPERSAMGIVLDPPVYRQQRILYPLLVHVASLGRTDLIPWMLLAVNFVALCCLGYLGGVMAQMLGRTALWGLVLPLHVGFVTSFSRDLSEILECTLVIAALVALRKQRVWATGLLLGLAVLTKEPALLVAVAIGLADLIANRRVSRGTWIAAGIPALVYLLWHLWLLIYWGGEPLNLGTSNQGIPGSGLWNALSWGIWHWHWPWSLACLLLLAVAGVVVTTLRTTRAMPVERCAWVLYALLLLTLSSEVWADNHAFVRASSEFSLLAALILLGAESSKAKWALVPGMMAWVGAALQVATS